MEILHQPNPNPTKISLNETKIIDLKEDYQIKSTSSNLQLEGYKDHYVVDKNNNKAQKWKYAIVTSKQNGKIESVIYRFQDTKFNELSNFLQNEASNIKISNTPVESLTVKI